MTTIKLPDITSSDVLIDKSQVEKLLIALDNRISALESNFSIRCHEIDKFSADIQQRLRDIENTIKYKQKDDHFSNKTILLSIQKK